MDISIIIPTYNRSELLEATLQTLVQQTFPKSCFEVIVADDGSSDNTREVVERFIDILSIQYCFQDDLGFRAAAARNMGIKRANAPICVFLDTGMLVAPNFVEAHLQAHQKQPGATAVVGYAYGFGVEEQDRQQLIDHIDIMNMKATIESLKSKGVLSDIRESKFYQLYGDNLSEQPAPWVLYWTCNVSFSTDALRNIQGFDEEFRSWGLEDIELAYRLFQSGATFVLAREAEAVHYPHERNDAENERTDFENKQYFHRKYHNQVSELLLLTRYNLRVNGMLLHLANRMDCSELFADEPKVLAKLS